MLLSVWLAAAGAPTNQELLEPIAPPARNHRLGHPPAQLDPVDQTFLVRFARRVMTARLRDRDRYESPYVPAVLEDMTCRVSVSLRRHGTLLGSSDSGAMPVMEACRTAAEAALSTAAAKKPLSLTDLDECGLEVELIGPRERVGDGSDTPVALSPMFAPAVHGVAVRLKNQEVLVRPSQIISREMLCRKSDDIDYRCDRYEGVLKDLKDKLGLSRDPPELDPKEVTFLRFRTTHLYEPRSGAEVVLLIGGMRPVPAGEAAPASFRRAVDRIAAFIAYRQVPEGIFSYEFLPGRDMYWPEDQNWIRQAATTWSIAHHARMTGDRPSAAVAAKAIEAMLSMAQPVADRPGARFIATPDDKHALGTTALVALSLIDSPEADRHLAMRLSLLDGIASLQREDGSFRTSFPPAADSASQDYYPGEALLAVARHYEKARDARWRDLCDKALPFYLSYFRATRPAMFVPWQAQAWGQMARTTRLRKYADFVFEMSDLIVATQITETDPTLPIYLGGFDVYANGAPGISTAVYVEGMVEAVRTAEAFGDRQRADKYRQSVRRAGRFVLQLCFREEECYYVRSIQDVLGGVRNTPINPTLRIDNMQHALAALTGILEVGYPSPPGKK